MENNTLRDRYIEALEYSIKELEEYPCFPPEYLESLKGILALIKEPMLIAFSKLQDPLPTSVLAVPGLVSPDEEYMDFSEEEDYFLENEPDDLAYKYAKEWIGSWVKLTSKPYWASKLASDFRKYGAQMIVTNCGLNIALDEETIRLCKEIDELKSELEEVKEDSKQKNISYREIISELHDQIGRANLEISALERYSDKQRDRAKTAELENQLLKNELAKLLKDKE